MSKEFIYKKLDQLLVLLGELQEILILPFSEFKGKFTNIRTAERNFQLIIELASDINTHILIEKNMGVPDTYRESFSKMQKLGIFSDILNKELVKSANQRNILVHEYDFDEDNFIFYNSAKEFLPIYNEYIDAIRKYLNNPEDYSKPGV